MDKKSKTYSPKTVFFFVDGSYRSQIRYPEITLKKTNTGSVGLGRDPSIIHQTSFNKYRQSPDRLYLLYINMVPESQPFFQLVKFHLDSKSFHEKWVFH